MMGITLRQETFNRFLRAAEFVESFRRGPSFLRGGHPNNSSPLTQNVLVTSTTAVDGRYPGKWLIRHEVNNQWLTQEADIWIRERNGAALTVKRYLGWRTGDAPDGKPCFLVDAAATVGDFGCDIQPVGCEADCGDSGQMSHSNHVHEYTFGTDIQPVGDTNEPGDDCLPARVDHVHAFVWPSCSPVVVYETDVLCQNYSLNVYVRPITINIVEGCLTASAGSWVLDHSAGCCDCCELYWCVDCECVQACEEPEGATAGPFATAEACALTCYEPFWCVDCGCVQACEEPEGATGGPFATLVACQAACYEPWWCVDDECVQSCTAPVGYTSGPHASESECEGSGCLPPDYVVTACCTSPRILNLTMGVFGTGSAELVYNEDPAIWEGNGSFTPDGCGAQTIHWQLRCNGDGPDDFEIRHSCNGGSTWSAWTTIAPGGMSCNPWEGFISDYTLDDVTHSAGCNGCASPEITVSGSFAEPLMMAPETVPVTPIAPQAVMAPRPRTSLPLCRHLGEKTGEKIPCGPGKKCSELVRSCAVFGECTMTKPVEGKACCQGCERFEIRAPDA